MLKHCAIGLLCLIAANGFSSPIDEEKDSFLTGWYLWDPYQYLKQSGDQKALTGLDVELMRELGRVMNKEIIYEEVAWKQHQQDLRDGTRDFAAGATYTDERAKYVYFSEPYRYEENSLFVRRGQEANFDSTSIEAFLDSIKRKSQKIGVIDGFIYASPIINKWIADPANSEFIVKNTNDVRNLNLLVSGAIDGFLADRLVGSTVIWREGKGSLINEVRLNIKTPIHMMFSKKTVSPHMVEAFNLGIRSLKETKTYNQIIEWYLHPVLLLQTVDSLWFSIVELLGTIAFAISGLAIAYRDRATMFGALIFAILPSMGGGIVRDVIFDRSPVRALERPVYLFVVIGAVFIGAVIVRIIDRYHVLRVMGERQINWPAHILAVADGFGLAAFTISGIIISVMTKVKPLWLWGPFFALLTGVGGGILRDLLSKQQKITALSGRIYPEIAVAWGFAFSIFLTYQSKDIEPDMIRWGVIITVIGIFVTSCLVYFCQIPNLYFKKRE